MSRLSTIVAVRCVAPDHCCVFGGNLGFRNQLVGQSALVFEDLRKRLADTQELKGIFPFLGWQCLGKDICSLLSCVNVLDANTATRRQLF